MAVMIPFATIAAELAREIASRQEAYPRQIAKGHLSQQEADRQIMLAQAWAEDCQRYAQTDQLNAVARNPGERTTPRDLATDPRRFPIAAKGAFPWVTRWRGVQDELTRRARLYPGWIAKGQLDQAEADRRVTNLTAMLHHYDDMADWQPRNGTRPRAFATNQTAAEQESFDEAAPYLCEIMLRRHWITLDQARIHFPTHAPAEQKEMFA